MHEKLIKWWHNFVPLPLIALSLRVTVKKAFLLLWMTTKIRNQVLLALLNTFAHSHSHWCSQDLSLFYRKNKIIGDNLAGRKEKPKERLFFVLFQFLIVCVPLKQVWKMETVKKMVKESKHFNMRESVTRKSKKI